ncbi:MULTISPECIES: DNA-3-methyladenine glycosylase family protein [Ralstonia solanacearum species complex]|uniref:DNA-3-methyladenine glycosylase II n=3 Tax=Ralstonia solanacearum species complex TaxID=3116862 RepID=A0ABY6N8Z2_RALSL|nr:MULTISPECIES: DNA-3-methyladenine glycosylase [Ralstonia]UZF13745.1 DNA-3-methyladenine glycosylase [Ralstonia solanacearum]MCD9229212.1 DNA-3-methyladenine glycosylase [Ralstonia pseudosolanacearum]MCK4121480.1 DNA-3-methyladenine glycosylase 2 family protein [Ralstonia pseudosolanacearum]MCK4154018.1 DNA-3-methyladenine glycosylase 2 family protein [Ralstonia pseudosolanacearum]QUP58978.1 DNA-3-methyladenine glycosylase 2 family protein [Ralstonia nicotianae]
METRMNAVAKKAGVARAATVRKAAPAKAPAAKKAAAKRVDGVASKTVAAKGAVIQAAKRAAGSRVPLPEVPATSEPLPVPTDAVTLSGPPAYWQEACADLMKRDRILRKIIPAFGPAHLASRGDPFVTLARSIVGQQISVKAAQSVWERLVEACPKLVPAQFLRAGHEKLAGCGLSKRKAEYILDLAEHFRNGTVHVAKWAEMEDEDVIAELTQIRGIGRWTAEMFLMFNLLRPNVLPLDDIGLINAISQNYFSGEPVTRSEAREVAANWEPWRTVATWYMWRSLDTATTY